MTDQSGNGTDTAAEIPMTPLKGLLVLMGVVVVVGGYIGLNSALGIHDFWAGFLFLLYWAAIEHMAFDKLPACIVGALVGLLMGWLLFALPVWFGETGGLIFLGLVLALVYCQIMGWLPVAVNAVTMLFLTVGTIPAIQHADTGANFTHALVALVLAFVYFIGLMWIATLLRQRKEAASATA